MRKDKRTSSRKTENGDCQFKFLKLVGGKELKNCNIVPQARSAKRGTL